MKHYLQIVLFGNDLIGDITILPTQYLLSSSNSKFVCCNIFFIFTSGILIWYSFLCTKCSVMVLPLILFSCCYHQSCTWWFYQVSLVNQTKMICSKFRRPSDLLLGSVFFVYHMFISPWGGCNKMFYHGRVYK